MSQHVDPTGSTEQFRAFMARREQEPKNRLPSAMVATAIGVLVIAVLVYLAVS